MPSTGRKMAGGLTGIRKIMDETPTGGPENSFFSFSTGKRLFIIFEGFPV